MKKPITVQRDGGLLRGRDAIWHCIRTLKRFSVIDIEILSTDDTKTDNLNRATIRSYVYALELGGYLKKLPESEEPHSRSMWELQKDVGMNAPRIDKQGNELPETKREQMWRAIRILGSFDIHAVMATCDEASEVKFNDVKDYIKHLNKAGYLLVTQPSSNGGGIAKYRLLPAMNTGPRAPVVQRVKQVFDQNLNKVVWPKEGEAC